MSIIKRLTSLAVPVVVLGVLVNEIISTPIYTDRELAAFRERDIELARRGEFETALRSLKALTEIAPNDPLIWGDYLVALTWAGRDAEAVQAARNPQVPLLPAYALAELFEAALRSGDSANASRFAIAEIRRSAEPANVANARYARLLEVNADEAASAVVAAGLARDPDSLELMAAQDLLAERRAAPAVEPESEAGSTESPQVATTPAAAPTVVAAAPTAATVKPAARPRVPAPARPARNVAAAPLESPPIAAEPVETAPRALDVAAEQAREAVRSAEQAPPETRRQQAELALDRLDAYSALLRAEAPDDAVLARNAQLDRVRALTLAGRLEEARALFEALGDPAALPAYGLLNGADVYARLRQPEKAEELLQLALQQTPDDTGVLVTLFYNQLDRELYAAAGETLQKLQALSGDAVVDGRATWIARLAAMFEAYQNDLQAAQEQLEALRIRALNDPELDLNLATIYRWRGWSARALDEYRKALADGADPVAVQAGTAQALFELKRYREAGAAIAQLGATAPANPDTVALQSQWEWFNKNLYIAQAQSGKSDGSPVTGSSDLSFDQWLYSKPIAGQFRAFIHHHYDWADFIEGAGGANRTGIGFDYRSQFFDIAVAATNRSPGSRKGLAVNGEYRPDEHWTLFGDVQTDSNQVPLRGTRAGVNGHSASGGVLYRWDERRHARLSYTRTDLDDGNVRDTVGLSGTQRLWADARHTVALNAELYYSHGTAGDDVAYYNPKSDHSAYVSVDYTGVLQRRGDRTWVQHVNVGGGGHEQHGFSSRAIWHAQYEQRWQFGPQFGVNYGVLYRSRVYDGERESYAALTGGIEWRF